MVQVVVIVALIAMAVGGMTYAFFGQLAPLFGTADETLAGNEKNQAHDQGSQDQVSGHAADPNAMQNSMQQQSQQNTAASAKAKGTP